jgi:uncharacterized membrane protein YphA (DoxX/SURF4 family)
MQRLFTTFPNHWPGTGLLLLRIAGAAPLLAGPVAFVCNASREHSLPAELAGLFTGGLLAAGFLTPFAGCFQVLLQAWLGFHDGEAARAEHGLLAVTGLVLVMTGPGAWSVDARLFGRKRIAMDV